MRVIHMHDVDFSKLKDGDLYESLCGNRYIACDPPTPEQCVVIQEKTKNDPICKGCQRVKKRRDKLTPTDAQEKG